MDNGTGETDGQEINRTNALQKIGFLVFIHLQKSTFFEETRFLSPNISTHEETMKKILLLSVNPKGTYQLRLDEEFREIQEAFKRSTYRDQFEIYISLATRVSDLRRALLEYKPNIVHFSGHGSGNDGLILENELGQQQPVSSEALTHLFELCQKNVECVLLNACHSEFQAQGIYNSIDCVITMQQAIGDKAAIKFALGFYDALGAGEPYEIGFKWGCSAIASEGIPDSQTPKIRHRERAYSYAGQEKIQENQKPTPTGSEVPEKSISQTMSFSGGQFSNGQFSQAGRDFKQTQQISNGSPEKSLTFAEALVLINQIERLIDDSDLSEKYKRKALNLLETVQEEIQGRDPDKDFAFKNLQRLSQVLKEANETNQSGVEIGQKLDPIFTQLAPWLGVTAQNLLLLS